MKKNSPCDVVNPNSLPRALERKGKRMHTSADDDDDVLATVFERLFGGVSSL